jgi:hypothetical protein
VPALLCGELGGSMSTSNATTAMKQIGRDFWGGPYVTPMAAAMGTDGHTLKHWGCGKGPVNLRDRLVRLLDSLIVKHVALALKAVEWKLRLDSQSDIALADRLRNILRELAPPPKAAPAAPAEPPVVYIVEEDAGPALNLTIDQLAQACRRGSSSNRANLKRGRSGDQKA